MKHNIKIIIQYDGTNFYGWQIQPNNQRTVADDIIKAYKHITGETIKLIGAGRTDRGVHALGQTANFKTKSKHPPENLKRALNALTGEDMTITGLEEISPNFHAQYSAKSKHYRYTIINGIDQNPLQRAYSLHHPYKINLPLIRTEAKNLIGRHDFKPFQASDHSKKQKDTIRTVKYLDIRKRAETLTIDIEADGFLYKMVRGIVGTLLEIGSGKHSSGHIQNILQTKNRDLLGPTASAHGLCLMRVKY